MSPERYRRITDLVESALDLPADRREEFLRQACSGDEELCRETAEFMDARERSSDFLNSPALELMAADLAGVLEPRDFSGRQIGRYRVLRAIATGGMGEVWLATDARLARQVALKLLPADSSLDPSHALRFQREAEAASALNHPNIVTIYEIGDGDGVRFIAQEFVAGETLRQRLTLRPMELATVVDLSSQIVAALAAAHAVGIAHRDIKPENVMLRPDGLVKVLDFGLARFVNAGCGAEPRKDMFATLPGLVIGTIRYMSPEQVRGVEVSRATDLFSLGVVMYEMITGAPPFSGATAADIISAILLDEPAQFARKPAGLLAEAQRIVFRCLQKDAAARYASAAELQSDLKRLARSIEVAAGFEPHLPAAARRKRLVLAGAISLILLAALGTAVYRRQRGQSAWLPGSMHVSRLAARTGLVDAAISPDGKRIAYALNDAGGQSLWVRRLAVPNDVRVLAPEKGELRGLVFSPDGNYLYYIRTDGGPENLYRVPVPGGEERQVLTGVNSPIAFAPNHRGFAFVRVDVTHSEVDLMTAAMDGSGERQVAARRPPASYSQFGLAWSPDGKMIACFGNAGVPDANNFNLVSVSVADGAERRITAHVWADANSPVWLADGEILLAGKESPQGVDQIWAVSPADGHVRRITNDLDSYSRISVTADGKFLAAVQTKAAADIWVVPSGDAGHSLQATSGSFPLLTSVAWTPAGKIVFSATGGDYESLWTVDADGKNTKQLTSGPGFGNEIAVTAGGYILYQFERNLWRIDFDGSHRTQLTHGSLDVHPAPFPFGSSIIYVSFEGWSPVIGGKPTLWKMSLDGGDPVRVAAPSPASFPEVSPDGKLLAYVHFLGDDPRFSRWQVLILPAGGGTPLKRLETPDDAGQEIHWPGDARAIDYVRTISGVDDIWRQRLDGGAPIQITNFPSGRVSCFAWSRDGSRLALVRGQNVSDIVAITGF